MSIHSYYSMPRLFDKPRNLYNPGIRAEFHPVTDKTVKHLMVDTFGVIVTCE